MAASLKLLTEGNHRLSLPAISLRDSNIIRAMCCLIIIAGHVRVERVAELHTVVVAIFFFFSAYGMYTQFIKKGSKYLDWFIVRKVVPLLVTYWAALVVLIVFIPEYTWSDLPSFMALITYPYYCWFMKALIIFYLAFYVVLKLLPKMKTILQAAAVFGLFYAVVYQFDVTFARVAILFMVGMVYARYAAAGPDAKQIKIPGGMAVLPAFYAAAYFLYYYTGNFYTIMLVSFAFMMNVAYMANNKNRSGIAAAVLLCAIQFATIMISTDIWDITQVSMTIAMTALLAIGFGVLLSPDSRLEKIMTSVGDNSFEIYLVQGVGLTWVSMLYADPFICIIVAIPIAYLFSILLRGVFDGTKKKMESITAPRKAKEEIKS